jgi:hypothetical protein
MAMKGQSTVYAAISMARGGRAIYFTAPIFSEYSKSDYGVGAVVARTNLAKIDELLKTKSDIVLLMAPQGVVFSSSKPEWMGRLDGVSTPQRIKAIRELKQFGALFDSSAPEPLPVVATDSLQTIQGTTYAVAQAAVGWNDPAGEWKLVLMEDLQRTAPIEAAAWKAGLAAVATLLLGWLLLKVLRGQHVQNLAASQLRDYAAKQDANVQYRALLAAASLRMQRCDTVEELAQSFLADSRELLGSMQGAMYAVDLEDSQTLRLIGANACADSPPQKLALGEGLLGQCALGRSVEVIPTPPQGIWTVKSGLGDAQPAALLLAPVVIHDLLIGAVELAVLQTPDELVHNKFEEMVLLMANSLEILRRHSKGGAA